LGGGGWGGKGNVRVKGKVFGVTGIPVGQAKRRGSPGGGVE